MPEFCVDDEKIASISSQFNVRDSDVELVHRIFPKLLAE
jgi:hypothetical protein